MGNSQPKKEPAPELPLKDQVKEMSREIRRLIRGFKRDEGKLTREKAKLNRDLERSVKKGEQKACQISIAKNMIRTTKFIDKYKRLQVQLQNVDFQLQSVSSADAMSRVMGDMAKLMKKQSEKFNIEDMQHAMRVFNEEMEKGEMINERLEEMMDLDEDESSDDNIEELIRNAAQKVKTKPEQEDDLRFIEKELQ